MSQKLGKAVSQWSTLETGPLAAWGSAETRSEARKSHEPVVHSTEWTTGSPEKAATWSEAPKKQRPNALLAN